jgi:hypothetical protein
VEECTYFWGVNTSWGINMAESKRPINQEDNQAPQPTPIRVEYVGTKEQVAYIFTKPLPWEALEYLRQRLGVIYTPK